MNDISIRLARENDADEIESVIQRWWRIDRRPERVQIIRAVLQKDGHEIIVAELEGAIVGILHLVVHPDVMFADQYSHIVLLLVDRDHRRRGIGLKLLEKAMKRAKEQGAAEIHVDTAEKEAEQLFRKLGFEDDGVMLARPL
jgi:N-acetylglutamate synthase-like GNAT family acetyltransferase